MNEKDKQTTAQLLRHYQIECGPLNAIAKDILESSVLKALTTIRQEARAAAFRDAIEIIDTAADGWSDLARARKSQTFSAYVIAALDLKGQLNQAAANSGEGVEDDG